MVELNGTVPMLDSYTATSVRVPGREKVVTEAEMKLQMDPVVD